MAGKKKTAAQLDREVQEIRDALKSRHSENEKKIHPEMFYCMNRGGEILGMAHSIRGAMSAAPDDKSYAIVRGEYTSDGTHHKPGRGRQVAVREFDPSGGFRWYVG